MNKSSRARVVHLAKICVGTALGLGCILWGIRHNINLFITPSYLIQHHASLNHKPIRLGGKIKKGSIQVKDSTWVFQATEPDQKNADVLVTFSGIPPSLFKEETWIIAEGVVQDQVVVADRILAKHDENYQPPGMQGDKNVG